MRDFMVSFKSISSKIKENKEGASIKAINRFQQLSAMKKEETKLDAHLQSIVDGMKLLWVFLLFIV